MNDVSPYIKAVLDYMKGLHSSDDFVNERDVLVNEFKSKEEERVSYMIKLRITQIGQHLYAA